MASELAGNAVDVTALVYSLAPELEQRWGPARILLVTHGDAARRTTSGGLAPGVLRRVRQYVDQHLTEPVTLRDLADVAGLSACHFSRAFKQSVGVSPRRFLTMQRVARALERLRHTDQPICDVSQDLGFADQSHFTRCFVAVTRQTPSAFRRSCR
jgi:AraC-like DNA-binding protein